MQLPRHSQGIEDAGIPVDHDKVILAESHAQIRRHGHADRADRHRGEDGRDPQIAAKRQEETDDRQVAQEDRRGQSQPEQKCGEDGGQNVMAAPKDLLKTDLLPAGDLEQSHGEADSDKCLGDERAEHGGDLNELDRDLIAERRDAPCMNRINNRLIP